MKRNFPDRPLGEPVKSFDETFSAQTILLEEFFPTEKWLKDPEVKQAVHRKPAAGQKT
jgi:hypothetical protein